MTRLLVIPVAFVALLAGALVWSGGSATRRADFTYIDRGDIFTLDLNQVSYMQDFRLLYGIREGLFGSDPVTLGPIPTGALSHEVSPDKRVWTFKLRPDARWTNGDPVTAHDYLFSWRRMLEEPGEYTYLWYGIKNARAYEEAFVKGEPIDFKQVGIEALDSHTLRVTLNDPLTYFEELLAFPVFYPRNERSMRPFRHFVDTPVADRLREYAEDPSEIPASAPEAARRAFAEKAKGLDIDTADEARILDVLPAFAALQPFDAQRGKAEADAAEKLRRMVQHKFVRTTYHAEYTRPAPGEGKPGVVTNGPYELKVWEFKRRLILEKSDSYWDKANVKLERVEKAVNDNKLGQFLSYESGAVEWLSDVDADLAAELIKKKRTDLRTSPAFGTMFMTLMVRPKLPDSLGGGKNPLADVRVRQALAMSIDKQFIVDNITRIGELPARTYLPPDGTLPDFRWLPGPFDTSRQPTQPYKDAEIRDLLKQPPQPNGPGLPYDVAKARQLLAEAGFPNGQGFPALPILFHSENVVRGKIAQALKNQWKSALNLDFTVQTLEGKIVKERVSKKDYAIATVTWFGDYPDASTFTDKYHSTSLQNDSDYVDPAFDALLAAAAKEPDAVKRTTILSQAEHKLDTEVPIIPIYHYVNAYLSRDNAHNVAPNPRSIVLFKHVYLDPVR